MDYYELDPIGIIRSPYKRTEDIPRQGHHRPEMVATAVLEPKWARAMMGLELHERLLFLFLFHRSEEIHVTENRPWFDGERGVFATRSPHRPNHIGVTEVEVVSIQGMDITFRGPDMLDGTPLVDIKPLVRRDRPLECLN